MLKIGIESTAYFSLYDYEAGFKKMRCHGYDAVDYSELASPDSDLYKMKAEEFRAFLTGVGQAAEENGIEIVQLHGLWPTFNEDKTRADRQESKEHFIKDIEAAYYLGCKNIVIHPFMPFGAGFETDRDKIWDVNYELFSSLMPYAEKYDKTICVENLPFTAIQMCTVREIKKLVRKIDNPHLKICFDTGHAHMWHENIADNVRLIGSDLATLHVHDNKGRWDQHLIPYFGTINWNEFLSALKEIDFQGCLSLETFISKVLPEPILEEMRLLLAQTARMMATKIE